MIGDNSWKADIAAAEKENQHKHGDEALLGAAATHVDSMESNFKSEQVEVSSDIQELSSEGAFDERGKEFAIDEELQMSSSIEPTVAAWPEVQVARGTMDTD